VIVDRRAHLYLFDLDDLLVLARLGGLLLLLILELAIVQDLADRRLRIRRDLDQVEAGGSGALNGVEPADNTDILAVRVDQSDFAGSDRVVDLRAG
jgi:hypothetical protein